MPAHITLTTLTNSELQPMAVEWARDNRVDAVAFVTSAGEKLVKCGLLCPDVLAIPTNNGAWDQMTPAQLKKEQNGSKTGRFLVLTSRFWKGFLKEDSFPYPSPPPCFGSLPDPPANAFGVELFPSELHRPKNLQKKSIDICLEFQYYRRDELHESPLKSALAVLARPWKIGDSCNSSLRTLRHGAELSRGGRDRYLCHLSACQPSHFRLLQPSRIPAFQFSNGMSPSFCPHFSAFRSARS
jgi:hypothetical protein